MNRRTTWVWCVAFACAASGLWRPAPAQSSADAARVRRDIETLAHDRWEGRATCTPGIDSAAAFIAQRFAALRLIPAGPPQPGATSRDFFHRYTARPQHGAAPGGLTTCAAMNVAGIIRGSDPKLASEFVVIGAHYDHLGRSMFGSRGPTPGDGIHNGADDNASGTAAVLELARLFAERQARRSILFVAFSGEEWGLLGSDAFVAQAMPSGRVQAMLNFDMVGRLKSERLLVFGVGTAKELTDLLNENNRGSHTFNLGFNPDGFGPSDHSSFYKNSIPVLHFFTDYHEDYHKATDHANRINAAGEARVIDYAGRVARSIADRDSALTFVAQTQRPAAPSSNSGARPYLGSLPDMAASETPGLRLSGVTPGSPADKAGLKEGDLVVELDGDRVVDLQSYSDALYKHKPGDTIRIVVVRDGTRVTVTVTLGHRGS